MGTKLHRLNIRKSSRETIKRLVKEGNYSFNIHYSCESFYDKTDGQSPRITSIAVRNFSTGQTRSFSIHMIAERVKISLPKIEENIDSLEENMLKEFFEFVKSHQHVDWIHWNMRDANYGFAAIEHRFKVLGGDPIIILDEKKNDLAILLKNIYGSDYIGHPRLPKLIEENGISHNDFLSGEEEAIAFENKGYIKLHQSTLRKVTLMSQILSLVSQGKLKTKASWIDQHGFHPAAIIEYIREHWIISLATVILLILGLIIRFNTVFKMF